MRVSGRKNPKKWRNLRSASPVGPLRCFAMINSVSSAFFLLGILIGFVVFGPNKESYDIGVLLD
jgi:hypothetical protein